MKVQVLDTSALVEFLVGSDTLPEDEATRALDLLGCMQLHRYDHSSSCLASGNSVTTCGLTTPLTSPWQKHWTPNS